MAVDRNMCVELDLYLRLSPDSTENLFSLSIQNGTFKYDVHQIKAWPYNGWKTLTLRLPEGKYEILFTFIMGIPYRSVAAMDNIIVKQCVAFDTDYMVDTGRYQIRVNSNGISPGPRLNIKTVFPRYGDSHVKDKTVGETVLSLTWESLYW